MAKSDQKIQHMWSLICERAVVDSTSNNVSLTNVLEEVQIVPSPEIEFGVGEKDKKLIVIPMVFNLVSTVKKLTASEYNGEFQISVVDPDDKVLQVNANAFKIPAYNTRFRTIASIQGFPVTVPGEYKFLIKAKENTQKEFTKLGEVLFEVKIALPVASKPK